MDEDEQEVKPDITGKLEGWYVEQVTKKEFIIWGNVYDDKYGRFRNGTFIHTSGILNTKVNEGDIVKTRNSTYLLGKKLERGDDLK